MNKPCSYQSTRIRHDRINPFLLDLGKRGDNICWLWWQINKGSKPARADLGYNQRSVTCITALWQLDKEREMVCMHVCEGDRLIKWNQNEKWVKWPENKKKANLFFIFYCPVAVQLWESIYLFHAVINSDVHLIYLRQNWRLIQLEILLCVIREEIAWNIKVLTSLEEISAYSDGGINSFLQLFRLMFLVWPLVKLKVLKASATVLKYSELPATLEIYLAS